MPTVRQFYMNVIPFQPHYSLGAQLLIITGVFFCILAENLPAFYV